MRRRVKLSSGTNYSVVIPALNPEDVNSVVNVLFQVCYYYNISYCCNPWVTKSITFLDSTINDYCYWWNSWVTKSISALPGWQCVSSGPVREPWKSCMLCRLSENVCPPGTTQPNYGGKQRFVTSEVIWMCVTHTDIVFPNQQDQCFYQLRTIQQLGYVAFCHNRVNEGVGSFEVSSLFYWTLPCTSSESSLL